MSISIENLLNIPSVEVLRTEFSEKQISIHVKIKSNYTRCHRCGQKATEFHSDGEVVPLRHLPIFERRVYLYLHTKRYCCLNCDNGPTTTQHEDWYDLDAHCTNAYINFLMREMVGSTLADVERKHGVSYGVLRGLLMRKVKDRVDWRKFHRLTVLGLDEISLLKGHGDFVTIVSTRDEEGHPAILAVLEGREKETVKDFLQTIPRKLQATIEQVCVDMYEGFANAAKEVLPRARIVADRFHVAKAYRAALDELRKIEMRELKKALSSKEYQGLKGVMWALRRNQADLTDEEMRLLELLFECSPALHAAYHLREQLTGIFESPHTKVSAERALRQWIEEVKRSGLTCFDKFLGTLENWMDEITNYFLDRQSSGWVEGFNNKIKVIKRRSYGLSVPANLFRRIWLDLNGLEAFAH